MSDYSFCAKEHADQESSAENVFNKKPFSEKYFAILKKRQDLPVFARRQEFLDLLSKHQIIVLEGETGSGKTTQIPQFLVHALNPHKTMRMIGCTQPRRVAATSVSRRVAEEMDVAFGDLVGYTIRFEDNTSKRTILKYMTDGMLLREAMADPQLSRYSAIVLDEAHERTVATDILMGLMKDVAKRRPDLKIIVMSATLDAQKFSQYFDGAPTLSVSGRTHPVKVMYTTAPEPDYLEAAVSTVLHIHMTEPTPGDILVFLTGEEEIEDACRKIRLEAGKLGTRTPDLIVLPLYSALPPSQQQRIFQPAPASRTPNGPTGRKVIISTNIAETSLTIDGIVFVVDPGFSKQKIYNPRVRVESLLVAPISQASAKQRAGRAGRTRPGKAFRLYQESVFMRDLIPQTHPEILRCNLGAVVLELKKLGIDNLVQFDFMDPPAPETMMRALELLNYLGALDDDGELTDLGRQMGEFPLDPQLSRALIAGSESGCAGEMLTIVAMLSGQNCFVRPADNQRLADRVKQQFTHPDGDHLTLLQVFEEYSKQQQDEGGESISEWCYENFLNARALKAASDIRLQLKRIMERLGLNTSQSKHKPNSPAQSNLIRQTITKAFFMQVAHRQSSKEFSTVKDMQNVLMHPSSVITSSPEWVVYHEFVLTTQNYIRTCSVIRPEWLLQQAPHYYNLARFPPGSTKRALLFIESTMSKK